MTPIRDNRYDSDQSISVADIEAIRLDEEADEYVVRLDPTIRPSIGIVQAVAAISETDPCDLTPLAERIDPECLDNLFDSLPEESQEWATVSFSYASYQITVSATGKMTLREFE